MHLSSVDGDTVMKARLNV